MKNLDISFFQKQSSPNSRGCWIWDKYVQSGGYGQLGFKGQRWLAHRLCWAVCKGPIPEGLCVCHACDTPRCVNPDHLFLGSAKDNVADMVNKGRNLNGFCKGHKKAKGRRVRKLTSAQVADIRASDWKLAHLADKYGVSITTVCLIRQGKRKTLE